MLIPTRYAGVVQDTATGCYQPAPAPAIETRADALGCEVPRDVVDAQFVEQIERTVRMAARTLGLDPAPRVRWLPAKARNLRGIVFDDALGEIWVKAQIPTATRDTALHELRHVWQLRGDRYKSVGLLTYEQRQADADDFARTWRWDQTPAVVDQAANQREWERRYAPMHEAARQHVAEQQERGFLARHRGLRSHGYGVKVIQ